MSEDKRIHSGSRRKAGRLSFPQRLGCVMESHTQQMHRIATDARMGFWRVSLAQFKQRQATVDTLSQNGPAPSAYDWTTRVKYEASSPSELRLVVRAGAGAPLLGNIHVELKRSVRQKKRYRSWSGSTCDDTFSARKTRQKSYGLWRACMVGAKQVHAACNP